MRALLSIALAVILGLAHSNAKNLPSMVREADIYSRGSSAFLLKWKPPLNHDDKLTGYKIYYEEIQSNYLGERYEYEPPILDPSITETKIVGFKPNTKYRITIAATTEAGEGSDYFVEKRTLESSSPGKPTFTFETMKSDNNLVKLRIHWVPSSEGNTGTHFFTKYRVKGKTVWTTTPDEKIKEYEDVGDLKPNSTYEFRVVSVDGDNFTESDTIEIETHQSKFHE